MAIVIPRLSPTVLDPAHLHEKVLVLDITGSVFDPDVYDPNKPLTPARVMGMIQRAWVLNPERANQCDLIFACCRVPRGCCVPEGSRLIIGVFKFSSRKAFGKESFKEGFFNLDCDPENRYSFFAVPADDETWNRYTGLFLPPRKPGEANPVRYYEVEE